jgi:PAS domain S-box-containing protein
VTLFADQAGSLKRQRASQAVGFAAVIIAAAALIGWWAELPLLSSWGPGFATVKPATAVCLVALGVALMHPGKDSRIAFAVGLAVAALAMLGLGVLLFNVKLGIDRWLAGPGAASFRVTNAATLALGLAGGSLALSRFDGHHFAATVLGGLAGAIAVFALLGYLSGIDTLYGSAAVSSPPLPTAVGLLCIAGGIILRIGAMPVLRKPRPSWHLLVMLGCAIIAPLLLFGAYAGISIGDAEFDQVRKELLGEARALSAEVDREITGEIGRLQALAASPSLRQGDFAAFQHQAEASLALHQSGNIVLIDRNMRQLVDTSVPFGTPMEEVAVIETVERALVTGKPQVTGLFTGPVTKQLMFGIIVPVQIDGENRYALVRSPDPHLLSRLVAANELPVGWHAAISDATHRIIARSEQEDAFVGKELPPSQWHRTGLGGVFEFIDSEGQSSLEAYAWSELTGWETAVWESKALVEAPVRALWWTIGLMALLALALVVALASWLGRIIARSVGEAARVGIISGVDGPPLPNRTPVAEVNTLMAELRETAAKRQAAEDLLRESEHQLRLVADNAPVAIARLDNEARYKFVNRCLAERQGLPPERIIGKRVPEVINDKAFAIVEPHVRECLAGKAVEFEVEVPDRAGEPQFLHAHFEPEWRDDKVVGLVSASTNITRLKRAEAALRDSERQLRLVTDNAPVGIAHCDTELRYKFINRYHAERLMERAGATPEQVIGKRIPEVVGDEVFAIIEPYVRECLAGNAVEFEFEEFDQTGEPRFVHCRFEPEWTDGKVVGLVSAGTNITGVKRAEAALRDSEGRLYKSKTRLQIAMDAAQLASWQYDPLHRLASWDKRFKEIFDLAENEAVIDEVMTWVHPDDTERVAAAFQLPLDPTDPKPLATEYRIRRRNGEVRWVEMQGLAHFEAAGRERRAVSIVGTAADITERKKREEKEHLLMREINHRAKNMLSVVDAIAHQTATRSPEDFIECFSERIQALSANQDLLVRNDWKGVEIEDLVRAQLAHFADLIGSRIIVRGPELRLNATSAQALGLALHELATNAGKYGALSTDRGRVDVRWETEGDTFTMSWTERDGPPVSAPKRRGFGTVVMEAMAERSVDGAVDLDYAPSGVSWRLACSAANALELAERE